MTKCPDCGYVNAQDDQEGNGPHTCPRRPFSPKRFLLTLFIISAFFACRVWLYPLYVFNNENSSALDFSGKKITIPNEIRHNVEDNEKYFFAVKSVKDENWHYLAHQKYDFTEFSKLEYRYQKYELTEADNLNGLQWAYHVRIFATSTRYFNNKNWSSWSDTSQIKLADIQTYKINNKVDKEIFTKFDDFYETDSEQDKIIDSIFKVAGSPLMVRRLTPHS